MGKSQRDKGTRCERELANILRDYDSQAKRVPLSGGAADHGSEYAGDVHAFGLRWEAKVRADGFKQLYAWLANADVLAVKADRKEWLAVVPLDKLAAVLKHNVAIAELERQRWGNAHEVFGKELQ